MSRLQTDDGDVQPGDLFEQLAVRSLFLAATSIQIEKMILVRNLRANDPDPETLRICERLDRLPLKDMQADGGRIAGRWIARLKEVSDTKAPPRRLVDDLVRRKKKEIAAVLRITAAASSVTSTLDRHTIKRIAEQVAREEAERILPEDFGLAAELAGVVRGVTRDARQNHTKRKAQNRKPHENWIAVADRLHADDFNPSDVWEEPFDYGKIARILWIAGLATGLRPIEWTAAWLSFKYADGSGGDRFFFDQHEALRQRSTWTLEVTNAKRKAAMRPPADVTRRIAIGHLSEPLQNAIFAASLATEFALGREPDLWRRAMTAVAMRIRTAARACGFPAGLSMYDARHYFAYRAKTLLDDYEVAAAMGHANIKSAGRYGARAQRPARANRPIPVAELAALGLAAPSPKDVEGVYRRAALMQGWQIEPPNSFPEPARDEPEAWDPFDPDQEP